jgi:hypothetical protein
VYSVVDTSEYEIPPVPDGVNLHEILRIEFSRRPGSRIAGRWSVRHVLELMDLEDATGIGAATELPAGWRHQDGH